MQQRVLSRQRFITLDALRGVAALTVVAEHYAAEIGGRYPDHGYLAVDLFFLMSGFVIARANDSRFRDGLTFKDFLVARVQRLWPIMIVGWLLGVAAALPRSVSPLMWGWRGILDAVCNLVALPAPFAPIHDNAWTLNHPFWSLFFEFWVANVAYGLFWRQLRGLVLWAFIAISGLLALFLSFHSGLRGGFSIDSLQIGLVRVTFSFFLGTALFRLRIKQKPYIVAPSFVFVVAALIAFWIPAKHWDGTIVAVVVLLVFPIIVYFGANAKERFPSVGGKLGDASYAIYAVHWPILQMLLLWSPPHLRTRTGQILTLAFVSMLGVLLASADERLRRVIGSHRGRRGRPRVENNPMAAG